MRRVCNRFLTFRRVSRAGMLATVIATASVLSACSSDDTMTSFPPYQYSYLSKLQLNVASVQVLDHAIPGSVPGDESGQAPIPPDQALVQMAQDRLVAAGQSGAAIFTIDRASILHQPGGTLSGQMDAHLDINSPTGQQLGVAEAHVTREFKPDVSKGDADSRANLYAMTSQMMQDMNVELEFQIRHNLKDWLVDAGGMPAVGAIQTQSLDGSGSSGVQGVAGDTAHGVTAAGTGGETAATTTPASAPASVSAQAVNPAEPDAVFPDGGPSAASDDTSSSGTGTTQKRSPTAGYLKLPSGQTKTTATPSTGSNSSGY
ncbi:hypothetical protein [Acetobacter fallax]|nr:hypothetical protein [Acetobacter fallax]